MSYSPEPQKPVPHPVMFQSWNRITFLHWAYDPEPVRRLLPGRLELETFDGLAWVGVTPFVLDNLHAPGLPPLPWLSTAPETNVRTYVRGPGGERGIWFFSLDIARLPAVLFARSVYFLPYMWADMDVEDDGKRIRYSGRRRWPGEEAGYDIGIDIGEPFPDAELDDLDHFLTARWVLFTFYGPLAAMSFAEHPRWPLVRARVTRLDETLLASAGLPEPSGDPLVHFSPGVDVRISRPRRACEPDRVA
jgi:uncharacterized protein YqjF (DUF2071 family)